LGKIRAALFDLDGTLLDSMNVWSDVDRIFFERHGMEIPADYAKSIAGMSYLGAAQYTKDRFDLHMSVEEIAAEWTDIARDQYANHVQLKSGARELLRALKARNVRLAVVTTLIRDLYEPCLKRHGIYDMFEFCLSTDAAGTAKKTAGTIYALAAQRLGVSHSQCAVYEDVTECILAAKSLGMHPYLIIDPHSTHNAEAAKASAEAWGDTPGALPLDPA